MWRKSHLHVRPELHLLRNQRTAKIRRLKMTQMCRSLWAKARQQRRRVPRIGLQARMGRHLALEARLPLAALKPVERNSMIMKALQKQEKTSWTRLRLILTSIRTWMLVQKTRPSRRTWAKPQSKAGSKAACRLPKRTSRRTWLKTKGVMQPQVAQSWIHICWMLMLARAVEARTTASRLLRLRSDHAGEDGSLGNRRHY
mmetsp:Transcript_52846/g.83935  ORF Transcript_52846/g.83935 Transcript_52846/m.83935 type:complete len:200 (-) Transcript_52846:157-756(-)